MSADLDNLSERAARLRDEFDRSFAVPAAQGAVLTEDFLGVRLCRDAHALRLSEIARVAPLSEVTRLPSAVPGLLGIVGFHGAVLPAYDLRVMLGYEAGEPARWMAVAATHGLALAFDAVDAYLRAPQGAATPCADARLRRHIREVLQIDDFIRPIVSIPSVLESIQLAAGASVN